MSKRKSKRLREIADYKAFVGLALEPQQIERLKRAMHLRFYTDPVTGERHNAACTCIYCGELSRQYGR